MPFSKRPQEQLPDHEELLLDYAERLRHHLAGRRAVHIHLSKLRPHHRREHHIRIAADSFRKLILRGEGQSFQLKNCDLVVVLKNMPIAEIDDVVLKLRYLFSEDPLAYADEDEAQQPFCTWYDLEREHRAFLKLAQEICRHHRAGKATPRPEKSIAVVDAVEPAGEPIDPQRLGRLERALQSMDLAPLLRRQPVCVVPAQGPPQPVFDEVYVALAGLGKRVVPGVDITADRWLFQRLAQVLDRRLLKVLPEQEAATALAASINITVPTLLSEHFLIFDKELRERTRKSIVLELQSIDIFADMGAYMFARDFVHERGYKICLGGLSHLTFALVRRDELGVDLEKIQWSPSIATEMQPARQRQFQDAVRRAGPARVVLCRCDDEQSVAFGRSLGVSLFQGRHIDRLLAQGAAVSGTAEAAPVGAGLR